MKSYKKLPLFLLTCVTSLALFGFIKADDDPIKKAAAQLDKWINDYPQEKVYLHFDKPYYSVGDDIWFKAYITVGPKHQLSALSGALNVELIDDRDSIKQAIKLPIASGLARGDFALSDTLKEGNYRIRAYTNWMRNFGTEYFFDKTIRIGNASSNSVFTKTEYTYANQGGQQTVNAVVNYIDANSSPYANHEVSYQVILNGKDINRGKGITDAQGNLHISFVNPQPTVMKTGRIVTKIKIDPKRTVTSELPVKATSNKVDVQFFPESGNLVNGLPSKVAFKAVGADGLGKELTGVVLDNSNEEVSTITTQHLGMGVFMLLPEAGKSYTAKLTFADGSQSTVALPKALEQGYVLTVNGTNDPDNIYLRITASKSLAGSDISLVAQSAGTICFASKNKMTEGILSAKIPKNRFPSGVAQFTIFDAAGNAINERLVFVNRPDQLKVGITSAQQTYKPREKVELQITANDPDDKPMISSLSAAVIDETRVPVNASDETTILSSILLSSDIKGYIEQPAYYFEHADKKTQDDLDVLMLTQGYRRFEWKKMMNDSYTPLVFQPERSLEISGRVHTSGGKAVPNGKVTLFTTKGGTFILDTLTDKDGRFSFKNLLFKDSIRFVIQARTEKNKKDVEIELDNIARQIVTANPNAADVDVNVSSKLLPYLQNSRSFHDQQMKSGVGNHNIMLKEVVITEKKKLLQNSTNLNGAGNADQVITAEVFDKIGCPNIADCLQGRLTGVIFRNGIPYSTRSLNYPMQVIVDGLYMEGDYLSSISPQDVASVEVLRSGAYLSIYGSRGGGGVLLITTKKGGEYTGSAQRYTPGIITYTPKGYYQARTFYSPQYDDPKVNTTLADLRSTIYWNANIITDKEGKASVNYYNAGAAGTYRVVVEGVDSEGHIGRQVYSYKVE